MPGSVGQFTQCWLPWVGHKAVLNGSAIRVNATAFLGMGYFEIQPLGSTTKETELADLYLDGVTWKYCQTFYKDAGQAIHTIKVNGTAIGTIDAYNATDVYTAYAEITGYSPATAGIKTLSVATPTKNASSSNYQHIVTSVGFIRTGGTPSTPAGTDTPGYTWELAGAWMGSKGNTGGENRVQNSANLSGGYLHTGSAQNNEHNNDVWLEARTYKFAWVYLKDTSAGIASIQLDDVEKGTIDGYAASGSSNNYSEVTGITVATAGVKNFKMKGANKNASSAGYLVISQSEKWISTGA